MRQKVVRFLKDPFIANLVKIFAVVLMLYIVIAVWKWSSLPPQIPLFYSFPRSTDQLASPWQILLLPFFSLLFFCLNFIIASLLYPEEKLVCILLVLIGLIVSLLFFTTFIKIIFLIT